MDDARSLTDLKMVFWESRAWSGCGEDNPSRITRFIASSSPGKYLFGRHEIQSRTGYFLHAHTIRHGHHTPVAAPGGGIIWILSSCEQLKAARYSCTCSTASEFKGAPRSGEFSNWPEREQSRRRCECRPVPATVGRNVAITLQGI
jgi:hypothetical protein